MCNAMLLPAALNTGGSLLTRLTRFGIKMLKEGLLLNWAAEGRARLARRMLNWSCVLRIRDTIATLRLLSRQNSPDTATMAC